MGERNGIENYLNNLVKEKQEEDAKLGKTPKEEDMENVMTEERAPEQRPQEKDGDLFDQKI